MSKYLIFLICLFQVYLLQASNKDKYEIYPKPHESYQLKKGKMYYRKGNAGLTLELATPEVIAQYYAARGAEMGDPFEDLPAEPGTKPVIFLLTLYNHTNGSLTFTPGYSTIMIKTEAFFPLDFVTMLEVMEDYDDDVKKIFDESIFHSPETLLKNSIVSKFVIFPGVPENSNELRLHFDYLYFETQEVRVKFYFGRRKITPTR